MSKKISAAIVTFQRYEKARATIDSLLRFSDDGAMSLYVVDNASGDGTAERLQEEFSSVTVIQNPENGGFGYGHNTVLDIIDSEYHAVINPDILIDRDVLTEIVEYMDKNPDIGLVTPKILNADKSDQMLPKRDPVVLALVGRRIFAGLLKKQVAHYQMLDKDLGVATDIEYSTGCFFVIRTDLFKEIGGFDPHFFMYYEDMDISRRARQKARVVYYPGTQVCHIWERDSAKSLKYFVVLVVGMFKYFNKWGWKFRYNKKEMSSEGAK